MKSADPDQTQAMQRIKVGMTGLAAVILLILLAGAIFNSASREPAVKAVGSPKPDVVANLTVGNTTDSSAGPLAELGVAPSTMDNAAAPTQQPPPAPGPRR